MHKKEGKEGKEGKGRKGSLKRPVRFSQDHNFSLSPPM